MGKILPICFTCSSKLDDACFIVVKSQDPCVVFARFFETFWALTFNDFVFCIVGIFFTVRMNKWIWFSNRMNDFLTLHEQIFSIFIYWIEREHSFLFVCFICTRDSFSYRRSNFKSASIGLIKFKLCPIDWRSASFNEFIDVHVDWLEFIPHFQFDIQVFIIRFVLIDILNNWKFVVFAFIIRIRIATFFSTNSYSWSICCYQLIVTKRCISAGTIFFDLELIRLIH